MLALRPAALFVATFACTRPEPEPPRPPAAPAPDPIPPKPLRTVQPPYGVDPDVLAQAGLEPGDPEIKCRDSYQLARCVQARAHPEVAFHWTLSWNERGDDGHGNTVGYSESDLRARKQRVIDRLKADGATRFIDSELSWVWVVAPHPAVRAAMAMPEVDGVDVGCAEEDRTFCACERLTVDQCPQHAFCQSTYGPRQDPRRACIGPRILAGCTRDEVCRDISVTVLGPTGVVWTFPDSCKPDQPGWRYAQAGMQPLPDCAAPRD